MFGLKSMKNAFGNVKSWMGGAYGKTKSMLNGVDRIYRKGKDIFENYASPVLDAAGLGSITGAVRTAERGYEAARKAAVSFDRDINNISRTAGF